MPERIHVGDDYYDIPRGSGPYSSRDALTVKGVKKRTCGHAFVLAMTCKECKRWSEETRARRG